jgi:putative endonuclease
MKKRETGIQGEKLACEFLGKNGYQIIEKNYRCPYGEIDIIARHNEFLVFVEVRTKTSGEFGTPEDSITPAKMERLSTLATYYGIEHDDLPALWRIDVVAIEMNKQGNITRIELIEDAVN